MLLTIHVTFCPSQQPASSAPPANFSSGHSNQPHYQTASQGPNGMYAPGGGAGYPAPAASLIDAVPQQQPAYPYFQQGLPPAQVCVECVRCLLFVGAAAPKWCRSA